MQFFIAYMPFCICSDCWLFAVLWKPKFLWVFYRIFRVDLKYRSAIFCNGNIVFILLWCFFNYKTSIVFIFDSCLRYGIFCDSHTSVFYWSYDNRFCFTMDWRRYVNIWNRVWFDCCSFIYILFGYRIFDLFRCDFVFKV